jgi:hypothetical protein
MSPGARGNLRPFIIFSGTLMSLFLPIVVLAALALWVLREFGSRRGNEPWPLRAKAILSPREQDLCRRLEELYPQHRVFAQVALSQLLEVNPGTANWPSIWNRFSRLVADFVLCREDFSVVAVIELDDSTHRAIKRQNADLRKTKAVESAGLRLVRIRAGELPSPDRLRELIETGEAAASVAVVASAPRAETAALLRPLFGVALVGLIVASGWVAYSRIITGVPPGRMTIPARVATAPAKAPGTAAATVPPKAPVAARPADTTAAEPDEQRRLDAARDLAAQEAADALERRKQTAWADFYQAPASCEHPAAWTDQVECGNEYIRAKKAFEKVWQSQNRSPTSVNASMISQ